MDKAAQDKIWNELSEESKKAILEEYDDGSFDDWNGIQALEVTFGKHNLNPKPPIKEWKDVPLRGEICDVKMGDDYFEIALLRSEFSEKLVLKIIATARISKIIELGYGGMVSEEEWKDSYTLHTVYCSVNNKLHIQSQYASSKHFITFHTKQQAEEFMSHESNRQLVKQYYLV